MAHSPNYRDSNPNDYEQTVHLRTLFVDPNGISPTQIGKLMSPYKTVSEAIASIHGYGTTYEILVFPGDYSNEETWNINWACNLTIRFIGNSTISFMSGAGIYFSGGNSQLTIVGDFPGFSGNGANIENVLGGPLVYIGSGSNNTKVYIHNIRLKTTNGEALLAENSTNLAVNIQNCILLTDTFSNVRISGCSSILLEVAGSYFDVDGSPASSPCNIDLGVNTTGKVRVENTKFVIIPDNDSKYHIQCNTAGQSIPVEITASNVLFWSNPGYYPGFGITNVASNGDGHMKVDIINPIVSNQFALSPIGYNSGPGGSFHLTFMDSSNPGTYFYENASIDQNTIRKHYIL